VEKQKRRKRMLRRAGLKIEKIQKAEEKDDLKRAGVQ
jgi:hypothetical protein